MSYKTRSILLDILTGSSGLVLGFQRFSSITSRVLPDSSYRTYSLLGISRPEAGGDLDKPELRKRRSSSKQRSCACVIVVAGCRFSLSHGSVRSGPVSSPHQRNTSPVFVWAKRPFARSKTKANEPPTKAAQTTMSLFPLDLPPTH
jgi:hypothetical protein